MKKHKLFFKITFVIYDTIIFDYKEIFVKVFLPDKNMQLHEPIIYVINDEETTVIAKCIIKVPWILITVIIILQTQCLLKQFLVSNLII